MSIDISTTLSGASRRSGGFKSFVGMRDIIPHNTFVSRAIQSRVCSHWPVVNHGVLLIEYGDVWKVFEEKMIMTTIFNELHHEMMMFLPDTTFYATLSHEMMMIFPVDTTVDSPFCRECSDSCAPRTSQ